MSHRNPSPAPPAAHPPSGVLEDFVFGDLHPCRRVLVEAHLAFCDLCRASLARLVRAGSTALSANTPLAASEGFWSRLAARLDERPETSPANVLTRTPLPASARYELPPRSAPLDWQPQGDGQAALLGGDEGEGFGLFLVCAPPERVFPYHLHLGGEEIVILAGGYTDAFGHLGTGDYQTYAAGTAHAPRMDPGEVCWAVSLIVGGIESRPDPGIPGAPPVSG